MLRVIKNKVFILALISITVLIFMGVSAKQDSRLNWFGNMASVIISPVQGFFSFSGHWVEGGLTYFKDLKALQKENDELKLKVDSLEKERNDLLQFKEKNKELKEALNLKEQFYNYDFFGANIISKDSGNWFKVFNIDVGTKEGITNKSPVLTSKGLVGMVFSTGILSSKVISIIDLDSTVSARMAKTRELVLVKGDLTLKDRGLCRMDFIESDIDASVGDTVETSGIGGIYPKGIIIGSIIEIRQTNNDLNKYAIIGPVVDFKRLEEVFVLKSKN